MVIFYLSYHDAQRNSSSLHQYPFMSYSPINIIYAIHEKSASIHLPHFIFRLFIPKVRIHIHCRRHFRMPHQILQRLRIHPSPSHISTINMPAHMWCNPWQLHRMCSIIFPHHMFKIFLPMSCNFRHSIFVQE